MFHVDMVGKNCFLTLLSILIIGFQELLDLKDWCTLVFLFVPLWLCRISDKQLKEEEFVVVKASRSFFMVCGPHVSCAVRQDHGREHVMTPTSSYLRVDRKQSKRKGHSRLWSKGACLPYLPLLTVSQKCHQIMYLSMYNQELKPEPSWLSS